MMEGLILVNRRLPSYISMEVFKFFLWNIEKGKIMTDQKKIHHTANSLNAMIDRICARNGWTQDETLRPKSKISVTVKVAMPKPASSTSNLTKQTKPNMTLDEYKKTSC